MQTTHTHYVHHTSFRDFFSGIIFVVVFILCLLMLSSMARSYLERVHADKEEKSCVIVAQKNPHRTIDCLNGPKVLD
jgi:uncharacterized membrane protein